MITIYIWIHQNLITLCLDSLVETNNALGNKTYSMHSPHKTIKIYHFHITIKIYLVLFSLIQLLDLLKLSFVLLILMEMFRNDRRLRRMDNRGNNRPCPVRGLLWSISDRVTSSSRSKDVMNYDEATLTVSLTIISGPNTIIVI